MTEEQLPKDNEEQKAEQQSKTSTGLDQNVAGLLSYLVGFVTGIIFLLLEKENRFVRFHAMQSIFTFVLLMVINTILGMIPLLGWLVSILIAPLTLVLWIVLMVKAYQGQYFKLPWIGDMVEQQLDK
ncbi:DUF4870 domain-containing protein [Gracilibacillus lacisalsi]|uniref:DUF4870 domain-containing protein n=1 Tax=Gracilibacillus lacisalsi TaxID=393087 RepID=UPI00035ED4FD|nr:DUF4870 domain-containing protein [Gracilibacillus lacisalsi]